MFKYIKKFIGNIIAKIADFLKGLFNNAESVVVLSAAAIGTTAIIEQLPFYFTLPLWIESTAIIPVISVFAILSIISFMEFRHKMNWYIA